MLLKHGLIRITHIRINMIQKEFKINKRAKFTCIYNEKLEEISFTLKSECDGLNQKLVLSPTNSKDLDNLIRWSEGNDDHSIEWDSNTNGGECVLFKYDRKKKEMNITAYCYGSYSIEILIETDLSNDEFANFLKGSKKIFCLYEQNQNT